MAVTRSPTTALVSSSSRTREVADDPAACQVQPRVRDGERRERRLFRDGRERDKSCAVPQKIFPPFLRQCLCFVSLLRAATLISIFGLLSQRWMPGPSHLGGTVAPRGAPRTQASALKPLPTYYYKQAKNPYAIIPEDRISISSFFLSSVREKDASVTWRQSPPKHPGRACLEGMRLRDPREGQCLLLFSSSRVGSAAKLQPVSPAKP
ncbi:hypothetical protein L249_5220, partial [Ophiocordyceps polyrhachis-furcata BCC 54312]